MSNGIYRKCRTGVISALVAAVFLVNTVFSDLAGGLSPELGTVKPELALAYDIVRSFFWFQKEIRLIEKDHAEGRRQDITLEDVILREVFLPGENLDLEVTFDCSKLGAEIPTEELKNKLGSMPVEMIPNYISENIDEVRININNGDIVLVYSKNIITVSGDMVPVNELWQMSRRIGNLERRVFYSKDFYERLVKESRKNPELIKVLRDPINNFELSTGAAVGEARNWNGIKQKLAAILTLLSGLGMASPDQILGKGVSELVMISLCTVAGLLFIGDIVKAYSRLGHDRITNRHTSRLLRFEPLESRLALNAAPLDIQPAFIFSEPAESFYGDTVLAAKTNEQSYEKGKYTFYENTGNIESKTLLIPDEYGVKYIHYTNEGKNIDPATGSKYGDMDSLVMIISDGTAQKEYEFAYDPTTGQFKARIGDTTKIDVISGWNMVEVGKESEHVLPNLEDLLYIYSGDPAGNAGGVTIIDKRTGKVIGMIQFVKMGGSCGMSAAGSVLPKRLGSNDVPGVYTDYIFTALGSMGSTNAVGILDTPYMPPFADIGAAMADIALDIFDKYLPDRTNDIENLGARGATFLLYKTGSMNSSLYKMDISDSTGKVIESLIIDSNGNIKFIHVNGRVLPITGEDGKQIIQKRLGDVLDYFNTQSPFSKPSSDSFDPEARHRQEIKSELFSEAYKYLIAENTGGELVSVSQVFGAIAIVAGMNEDREQSSAAAKFPAAGAENYLRAQREDVIREALNDPSRPVLVRVPVEYFEVLEKKGEDIRALAALRLGSFVDLPDNSNLYIRLYRMNMPDAVVDDDVYKKYGLLRVLTRTCPVKMTDINKENTITLYCTSKNAVNDGTMKDIRTNIQSHDILKNSILLAIGRPDQSVRWDDPTGITREILNGINLIYIARNTCTDAKVESLGTKMQRIVRETTEAYKRLMRAYQTPGVTKDDIDSLTEQNILDLATSKNVNKLARALSNIIKLLPIKPIDTQTLEMLRKLAETVLQAA